MVEGAGWMGEVQGLYPLPLQRAGADSSARGEGAGCVCVGLLLVEHAGCEDVSRVCWYSVRVATTQSTGKTGNLVLTFSRQGKHREFCFGTGKNFETQGKCFSVTQGKF